MSAITAKQTRKANKQADREANSLTRNRRILIVSFLIIPVGLLLLLSYLPALSMFRYSFLEWDGYSPDKVFIGLDNYVKLFKTPEYFAVFKVSLYYLGSSVIQLGLALVFATLLSFPMRGKNFFKGAIFFPYLVNGVAVGFMFRFFFQPGGTLDWLIDTLYLRSLVDAVFEIPLWLGNYKLTNYSLASVSIWKYMGFNFIMFLGAIQSIPTEVYEAADIDGAGRRQQFKYIILPSIMLILQINILLSIKGALEVFEIPYIMTNGGNGSKTFVMQVLEQGFELDNVGLASAMAMTLLTITVTITIIQKKFVGGDD